MKLDLHGVKHVDVENTVKRFIQDCSSAKDEHHDIITGLSMAMQMLVVKELKKYNGMYGWLHVPGVVTFYQKPFYRGDE